MRIKQFVLRKTGILAFGDSKIQMYIDSLSQNNIPHRIFTGKEANEIYPDQLCLPEDYVCVMEDDGGILRANAAVAALQVYILASSLSF